MTRFDCNTQSKLFQIKNCTQAAVLLLLLRVFNNSGCKCIINNNSNNHLFYYKYHNITTTAELLLSIKRSIAVNILILYRNEQRLAVMNA